MCVSLHYGNRNLGLYFTDDNPTLSQLGDEVTYLIPDNQDSSAIAEGFMVTDGRFFGRVVSVDQAGADLEIVISFDPDYYTPVLERVQFEFYGVNELEIANSTNEGRKTKAGRYGSRQRIYNIWQDSHLQVKTKRLRASDIGFSEVLLDNRLFLTNDNFLQYSSQLLPYAYGVTWENSSLTEVYGKGRYELDFKIKTENRYNL